MPDDIAEAAGEVQWLAEQPGKWTVAARQTHVILDVPGGLAMLTVADASLLAAAVQVAYQLVHVSQMRAEQAKQLGGVAQAPGAEG